MHIIFTNPLPDNEQKHVLIKNKTFCQCAVSAVRLAWGGRV